MLCGWEGNRRSGVTLAMRHRLSGISTYGFNGLEKGDEHHSEYYGIFLSSLSSIVPLTSRLHYHEPKHLLPLTSNSSYPLHYFHLSLSDNSMRNEYEKQE